MKTKIVAMMLLMSGVTCCDAFGNGLLSRMMGRGGCGAASSCCDTGSSCGAGLHISMSVHLPKLRRGGACGGCGVTGGCGCDAAPVVAAPCGNACDSGCDSGCGGPAAGGLLSGFSGFGLRNRLGGCGGCDTGCDSGCGAPVVAAGCGCDSAANACDPCARGGFLSGLRGRLSGIGSRGCGCDTGVSNGCGCDNGVSNGCGCDNGCGNAAPCHETVQNCGRAPRCGLLDRIRSIGGNRGCGNACDSCDGQIVSGGCGCDSTGVAAPVQAVPAATDATSNIRGTTPSVDPNAFIIRGANYSNN